MTTIFNLNMTGDTNSRPHIYTDTDPSQILDNVVYVCRLTIVSRKTVVLQADITLYGDTFCFLNDAMYIRKLSMPVDETDFPSKRVVCHSGHARCMCRAILRLSSNPQTYHNTTAARDNTF